MFNQVRPGGNDVAKSKAACGVLGGCPARSDDMRGLVMRDSPICALQRRSRR